MISTKTLYLTSDKTKVVEEGDIEAAFLLVRAGGEIDGPTAKRYGITGEEPPPAYDAIADHAAKHGGETEAQAKAARARMLAGQPDPDGPPVTGERDNVFATDEEKRASTLTANKAIRRVPEDK